MASISMQFDHKKLERGFVDIEKAAFIATKNTLDTQAGLTRKNAVRNIESDFINRNDFTIKRIRFDKSKGTKISDLESRAGALKKAGFMELQETGGVRKPKKGNNLSIPTNRARGGSKTRLVSGKYYHSEMTRGKVKGNFKKNMKSKKAKSVARAYIAHKHHKFMGDSTGVYTVGSFKKTDRKSVDFNRTMIYNRKSKTVIVRKTPWLDPATKKPIHDGQAIFNSQINKLLKKTVI